MEEELNQKDKCLLKTYMQGFKDELDGKSEEWNSNPLFLKAYKLGRQDAIIGDDVRNLDYQTNEEILNKIYKNSL